MAAGSNVEERESCFSHCFEYSCHALGECATRCHVRNPFADPHKEEALYKQGEALYLASPDERLDAQITQEAVSALAAY
ncbi:MAG: hypothetical protein AAFQ08_03335, partial [Bacteroidota bacterium]